MNRNALPPLFLLLALCVPFACADEETAQTAALRGLPLAVTNLAVMGDSAPFNTSGFAWMKKSDSGIYSWTGTLFDTNSRYTLYFSANSGTELLLASGNNGALVPWVVADNANRTGPRPRKISFNITEPGVLSIEVNPATGHYTLSPAKMISMENSIKSVSLISTRPGTDPANPADPANLMQRVDAETWEIVLTNLIPGRTLQFSFALNKSGNDTLCRDPDNQFTAKSGGFADAGIATGAVRSRMLSIDATCESATITLKPFSATWTVGINGTPNMADGKVDGTGFFTNYVLTGTNHGLRALAVRSTGYAWYFGIDARMAVGATLGGKRGLDCVVLIDDTGDPGGLQGSFSLATGLAPVTLPPGVSVEYILSMRAAVPAATAEGPSALSNGIALIGRLAAGSDPATASRRTLSAWAAASPWGFYSWDNGYKICVPRYDTSGAAVLPAGALSVAALSWNAESNWGETTATTNEYPIAEALPESSSNATLGAAWLVWP